MVKKCDLPKLAALLNESIATDREVWYLGGPILVGNNIHFSDDIVHYSLAPETPKPVYREMTPEELKAEACVGTIVKSPESRTTSEKIGKIEWFDGNVEICNMTVSNSKLMTYYVFANPNDPRCGKPVAVEVTP